MAILREHIRAESVHDMDGLIDGMTSDCFNDVVDASEPFVGPTQTAERYRKHWEGFPDFTVRVRRILCADASCVVTENEWRGTHLGTFLGWPPTGKPVRMRAIVVWHFKGDALWGETIFFDNASLRRLVLRSKSRQQRVRWSRQRSRLSTHRFSATASHSNKFAPRMAALGAALPFPCVLTKDR